MVVTINPTERHRWKEKFRPLAAGLGLRDPDVSHV